MRRRKLNIDLSTFGCPDGLLPQGPQGRMARFAGRIVSFANLLPHGEVHGSGIACRRRPGRRPCPGRLEVGRDDPPADDVHWSCPVCRDSGNITGWKETRWDLTSDLQSGQIVSLYHHQAQRTEQAAKGQPVQVYTLEAELIGGPIQLERSVARSLRLSGEKTLHDLHELLRQAFNWRDDEPYDFMFGAPYEVGARRFTGGMDSRPEGPLGPGDSTGEDEGEVAETRLVSLDALELTKGQSFGYLFDFGEEWVHRLTISGIGESKGYVRSRVVEQRGAAPPQHPDPEDMWEEDLAWAELDEDYPMTGLYGPYIADETPDPEMWLAMDDLEQQLLVGEAHSQTLPTEHPSLVSAPLHALVHCLAETKLATGDAAALVQLQTRVKQGGSRHQAIHELGEQLAREILSRTTTPPARLKRRKGKKAAANPPHKARH